MSDKTIILIGYSGHGLVAADTALENKFRIVGYCEREEKIYNPLNLLYLGNEGDLGFHGWEMDSDYLIGIGDNYIRENIFNLVSIKRKKIISLINSSASVSQIADLGIGIFVNRKVAINALVKIGNNVLLNTGCIIEHECVIGNSVHIGPGAVLAGNVEVGDRTFVGANSVIKQGVQIGKDVVIGAGSVIISNIPDGARVVGNPSRFL